MKISSLIRHRYVYLILFLFAACNVPTKQSDINAAPSLTGDDAFFAARAASSVMMEAELGDIAQKSENAEVKKYGTMMVADQAQTGSDLKDLAASKNLILPDSMDTEDQQKVNDLVKKSPIDFDQAYIDMMVNDHIVDINLFKKEGEQGRDPDIRSFATRTIPVLGKQLDAAKAAQKIIAGR
jgi:putative membrane protein